MFRKTFVIQIVVLFLLVGNSFTWSQKKQKGSTESNVSSRSPSSPPKEEAKETIPLANLDTQESKPKPRYAGHVGDQYILDEDEGHHGGQDEGEFIDEEAREEHAGQEQERGYHNDDKKVDDETKKDFKETGSFQDFSQGGAVFDKHHKDRVAENGENEDVNQHDAGEKFGAEALKEHKLGKHKEKSKGHKKYGFKNVYHKEEYGDHKTFHDEFLDNDHFHDYDDKHEHQQMQGGRFSKGYKRTGENKEHDIGDEKHAWGKAGHDGQAEGFYEKGGHLSGHHHGHKKNEGHFDASSRHGKNSAHKLKKGEAPAVSSHYHQGDDRPQYYSQSDSGHGGHDHTLYRSQDISEPHYEGHHSRHHRGNYNQAIIAPEVQADQGYHPETAFQHHEPRTPNDARRLEIPSNTKPLRNEHDLVQQPLQDKLPLRQSIPSTVAPQIHSFHYTQPNISPQDQPLNNGDRINNYRQHYGLLEPRKPHHHHHHTMNVQPTKYDAIPQHSSFVSQKPIISTNHQQARNPLPERELYNPHQHNHRHFLVRPRHPQEESNNQHHLQPADHGQSKPYPWWQHSRSISKHHQPVDSHQASSHHHYGYAGMPDHRERWRPSKHYGNLPSASHHRPGFVKAPENFQRKNTRKQYHRHH
ncbi:uncharacterized protein TNCT_180431 [Trichonephila clavata]|uniref:Uncharacterized protein n=1 Tax=Trichonephila clavata TaxID=2740835 RepID=A0A8X6JAD5_TRICU|nr:uncharacterized protein TNCT_180431 [Trichonephila clavata]